MAVKLPQWQIDEITKLSQANKLSGVDPVILEVIDFAESGGKGGGVNSSGFGGYFGLGQHTKYTGGDTGNILKDTSISSFDQQAQIAASAFNSYLPRANGDPLAAERIYQGGSNQGASILAGALGIPNSVQGVPGGSPGNGGAPTASGDSSQPSGPAHANLQGPGAALQALNNLLNPSHKSAGDAFSLNPLTGFGLFDYAGSTVASLATMWVARGLLTAGFISVTIMGFHMLQGSQTGPSGAVNHWQSQQRIANESRRINITGQAETRRSTTAEETSARQANREATASRSSAGAAASSAAAPSAAQGASLVDEAASTVTKLVGL